MQQLSLETRSKVYLDDIKNFLLLKKKFFLQIFEINEPNGWIDVNTPKCDANSNCYFVNNNANWPAVLKLNAISREYLTATGLTVRSIYGVTDAGNM